MVTILAYETVRNKYGLKTKLLGHDMLDSKFTTHMPRNMPPIYDDILSEVIGAAAEVFPNIPDQ